MDTKNIDVYINKIIERMRGDDYSKSTLRRFTWILNSFKNYCLDNNINIIEFNNIIEFLKDKYKIDYYNPKTKNSYIRPLVILYQFEKNDPFNKNNKKIEFYIPKQFSNLFQTYHKFIENQNVSLKTKKFKLVVIQKFLLYLKKNKIYSISHLKSNNITNYILTLNNYSRNTMRIILSVFREALNWMYEEKLINFSGRQCFPIIRKQPENNILSYYSKEELQKLISSVDISKKNGVRDLVIISIFIYLGIRVSDVVNLKMENINWNTNTINIIQQKTGNLLTLPLIDEIKFPLLDYIKNYRYKSKLPYIFISRCAPHKQCHISTLQGIVNKYLIKANIDITNRHHGPHALRHSMATNLMNNNVPISVISSALGHASTRTTEIYLTVNEKNLSKLALEVPND